MLLLSAPTAVMLGMPMAASAAIALAHAFALLEFKKYTSRYQFAMLLASALALGVLLDMRYRTWPLLTFSMVLAGTASIARQAFMQRFTYVNLLWLDSGMAVLAASLFAFTLHGRPFAFDLWIAPLLPI
ncbi:MAG: hypothetical protein ACK4L7_07315, partial [Flavobacteriales bacterium]